MSTSWSSTTNQFVVILYIQHKERLTVVYKTCEQLIIHLKIFVFQHCFSRRIPNMISEFKYLTNCFSAMFLSSSDFFIQTRKILITSQYKFYHLKKKLLHWETKKNSFSNLFSKFQCFLGCISLPNTKMCLEFKLFCLGWVSFISTFATCQL